MPPLSPAEFAAAMAPLGPWDAARRVAVAVSGGPDSLALALLASAWGDPVALIVDHGLRPAAASEAEAAHSALTAHGIPATILKLSGLTAGPGLPARARRARYAALSAACRSAGLVDLLLGHHAGDQAETVLMRKRRGSGPAGLAGMAALVETDDVRLLRPLLAFPPQRLHALVTAAGLVAADDPTNRDLRTTRARLRQEIGDNRTTLLDEASQHGADRAAAESEAATELAERAALFPGGYALLTPGPVRADALAALVRSLSGRRLPVTVPSWFAASPRPATLAGVRLLAAGRLGPGLLLVREHAAPAVAAQPGTVWDGRFRVVQATGGTLGALGSDAAGLQRKTGLSRAVLDMLPALRHSGRVVAPYLGQGHDAPGKLSPAGLPAAGAPFLPAANVDLSA